MKTSYYSAILICLFSLGCVKELETLVPTTSGTVVATAESEYCSTVTTYATATALTGSAQFYYRALNTTTGLTGSPVAEVIKFAEVRAVNSSGATVQCGTTAVDGSISLNLPRIAGTYTIFVYSRSLNNSVKVSVLEDPASNAPYSISGTVTITSASVTASVGTLYAYARTAESAKIEGGAFNIHYNIWNANEYLRANSGNASFVAPKVTVYWKAGFNPYSYFGSPTSLISFYQSGQRKLYILGGYNGNVKTVDTDHFDNSIILHEYGHFLEDVYAISESPGGSHSGNATIDPRLAWSEGWANFFQAAVLGSQFYIDTQGFSSDPRETGESGSILIKFDLKQNGATSTYDPVTIANEGVFREVSISRALLKTISPTTDTYGAGISFEKLWRVFSSTSAGFADTALNFRNISGFFSYLSPIIAAESPANVANWTNVRSNEQQAIANIEYANPVTSSVACGASPKNMSPIADFNSGDGNVVNDIQNRLRSNDYYNFYHDGSNQSIKLTYAQVVGVTIDLDLVVYKKDYIEYEDSYENYYGNTNSTIAGRSRRIPALDSGTEIVSLNGLAAGNYLVNVKANSYNKITAQMNGQAEYSLKLVKSTETFLCPTN